MSLSLFKGTHTQKMSVVTQIAPCLTSRLNWIWLVLNMPS